MTAEPRAGRARRGRAAALLAVAFLAPLLAPPAAAQTIQPNPTGRFQVSGVSPGAIQTTEAAGAGNTVQVQARLQTEPTAVVTVDVAVGDTTECEVRVGSSGDYGNEATMTFRPSGSNLWNAYQRLTIRGKDDDIADGDQECPITLTGESDDANWNGAQFTFRPSNIDDDTVGFTVAYPAGPGQSARTAVSVTEAGGTDTFTVRLTSQPSTATSVNATVMDTTECEVREGSSGAFGNQVSLTFRPTGSSELWSAARTVTVKGKDDFVNDLVQSCGLQITATAGDPAYTAARTVTVKAWNSDDDPRGLTLQDGATPPMAKTSLATSEASGAGNTDTFTLQLASEPTATVTVNLSSSDPGEATVSPASIKFAAAADSANDVYAWNTARTVTVTGQDDNLDDGNQSYTITLDPDSPGAEGDSRYHGMRSRALSGTNADNDTCSASTPCVELFLSRTWIAESGGGNNLRQSYVTAQLSDARASPTTLTVTAAPSTNAAADDYNLLNTTITIPAGSTVRTNVGASTPRLASVDDEVDSGVVNIPGRGLVKLVTVSATVGGGATVIGPPPLTLEIREDDFAGLVFAPALPRSPPQSRLCERRGIGCLPQPVYLSVRESGVGNTDTFQMKLNSQPTADVRVSVQSEDISEGQVSAGSAAPANSAALTFTPANWDDYQTVTLTGVDDGTADGDQGYELVLNPRSVVTDRYQHIRRRELEVETRDTDGPHLVLSKAAVATSEPMGQNPTDTFTVKLGTQPSGQVTVAVSSSATDEATVDPSTLTFTTTNWDNEQTVTVTGVNDTVQDGDQPYTITLDPSGADYGTIRSDTVSGTNADDDTEQLTSLTFNPATIVEGAPTAVVVTVGANMAPAADTTVTITAAAGIAVSGGTLTLAASQTSATGTVTFTADDDRTASGSRTVRITAAADGYASTSADLTVTDDDQAGLRFVQTGGTTVTTEAGGTDTFKVFATSRPTIDVSVWIGTTTGECEVSHDGGASYGRGDLVPPGTDLRSFTLLTDGSQFNPSNRRSRWDEGHTVYVRGRDDSMADGSGSCQVSLRTFGAGSEYHGLPAQYVDVTNLDDDSGPVATLSVSSSSIAEGGTAQVSATLSAVSTGIVTVTVHNHGTGLYTADSSDNTITIPANSRTTTDTVTITAVDNNIDAADREVLVTGSAAASGGATVNSTVVGVALTITDDDTAALTVVESSGSTVTTEAGGMDTFTVALASQPTADVTVAVGSSDPGEATAKPATLTFTAMNWNTAQTVTVTGVDDTSTNTDMADQTYAITLNPSSTDANYAALATREVSGTNRDDDSGPRATLSVSPGSIAENGGTATVTAGLTAAASTAVTVTVTAVAGAYTVPASANTITIPANSMTSTDTVTITAVDNDIDAADRPVTVTGTVPDGAPVSFVTGAALTITDDDTAGLAVVESGGTTVTTEAGGTDSFTVALASEPTATVTVAVASNDAGEAAASPSSLTFTASDWATAQTVTVTGVDDQTGDDDTADQTYQITLTPDNADAVYGALDARAVDGTNLDNDGGPTVMLAAADRSISESGAGSSTTVTATLSAQATADVTVTVTAVAEAYTVGSDATITIPAGSTSNSADTATIIAADNDIDAPDREVTVTGTAASTGMVGSVAGAALTITDDDTAGLTVVESGGKTETTEAGGTDSFTVALSSEPTANVTVAVTSGDTGEATVSSATLTFTAMNWATAQTVTVTGVQDATTDMDQTYAIMLDPSSTDANYAALETVSVGGSNLDDDDGPTVMLSVNPTSVAEGGTATVTATLSAAVSGENVTVTVTAVPGAYTVGADATIVIMAGQTSNSSDTAAIMAVDDDIDGADSKQATVTGTAMSSGSAALGSVAGAPLTITDNDTAGLDLSATSGRQTNEADGTQFSDLPSGNDRFTVALSSEPTATVTVAISSSGQATASPSSLRFGATASGSGETQAFAWNDPQTVQLSSTDDTVEDGLQAFTITLDPSSADPKYNALPSREVTGTDTDDDVPRVVVELDPATIAENGGTSAVSIRLSTGASPTAISCDIEAVSGAFTVPAGAMLTVDAGDTDSADAATAAERSVIITAVDNNVDAPDRRDVRVRVLNCNRQANSTLEFLTITDDDDAPTVTLALAASSIKEASGTASETQTTVTAALSHPSSEATTVTLTAPAGTSLNRTTLTIDAGDTLSTDATTATERSATISAVDNSIVQRDQVVTVTGTAENTQGVGAVTGAELTIENDDTAAAALTLSKTAVTTREGGAMMTDSFTVRLAGATAGTVTVAVASSHPGEATVRPSSLTFTAADWDTPQTVTVTGVDDQTAGSNPAYTITLTPSSSDDSSYNALGASTVSGTNEDNDDCMTANPCVTLALSSGGEIDEDADSADRAATVTATLSHPAPAGGITVAISAAPSIYATEDHYTLTGTTLTFAATATSSSGSVVITAVDDDIDSKAPEVIINSRSVTHKLVTVSGSVTAGAALAPSSLTLQIDDDDTAGLVLDPAPQFVEQSFSCRRFGQGCLPNPAYLSVTEMGAGNTDTFELKLATQPTANVTVRVSSADDGEGQVSKAGDAAPARQTTLTFTPANWNTAQTVTLTGVDDAALDGDQEYQLRLDPSAPGTDAYFSLRKENVWVQTEDTSIAPTLVLTPMAIDESNQAAQGVPASNVSTVTATLENPAAAAVTITVSAAAVSPAVSGDFMLNATTLTIPMGQTSSTAAAAPAEQSVTITAADNDIDGPDEKKVTVSATSSGGGTVTPAAVTLTIRDDDTAGLKVSETAVSTSEDETTDTFDVSLETAPTATVTVNIASDTTSEATVDISTIRFGATASGTAPNQVFKWDDPQTVTVTGVDDMPAASDGARTYTITVSTDATGADAKYRSLSETVSGMNADNEAPTVTLSLSAASISENGGTTEVSATLDRALSAELTLTFASLAGAYTAPSSSTITIAQGMTTSADRVTLTAEDNTTDEANRTVQVTATASTDPAGVSVSGPAGVDLVLEDNDDAPTVTLSVADSSIKEASGTASETMTTVTAALSHPSSQPTTVTITAVADAYTVPAMAADRTITIAARQTTSTDTVTITAVDNSTDAPDLPTTVTGTAQNSHGVGAVTGASLTITDDEAAPTVTLDVTAASDTIDETDQTSGMPDTSATTVTATLSHASSQATTITVTALSGAYTVSDASITIAAGDTTNASDTAAIAAVDNSRDEPNRRVTVSGTAQNTHGVGTVTGASLTITDDDDPPTVVLAVSPAAIDESGAGNAATVTATLSGGTSSAQTVITVTAVANEYDVGADATITIAADATSAASDTASIEAVDNDVDAADLTSTVTATVMNSQGTGSVTGASLTIRDDDTAGLKVSETSVSTGEDGTTDTFDVSLDTEPTATVTVMIASDTTTEATVSPSSIQFGATASSGTPPVYQWDDPQTVTVTGVDDSPGTSDGAQTYTITVSTDTAGTDTNYRSLSETVSGTNADDESPTVSLSLSDASISENGGTTEVSATLDRALAADLTLTFASLAGAYMAPSGSDTITIMQGQTTSADRVTLTAVDNTRDEANRTVQVTATASTNPAGVSVSGPAGVDLVLEDDDAAPTVTLSLDDASISENGGTAEVTATLSGGTTSSVATTVTIAAVSGLYTVEQDAVIVIAAGTATDAETVTITAVDNTRDEANRGGTVTGSAANSRGAGGALTVTGAALTLEDDDAAPTVTLSLDDASISENGGTAEVTATLSGGTSDAATTVTIAAVSGLYTVEQDAVIVIAAGTATDAETVTITAVDNTRDEANRSGTVTGSAANSRGAGGALTVTGAALTLEDDDAAPTVTLSLDDASISENGGTAEVTATLSGGTSDAATTVTIAAVSGLYTVESDAVIVIAAGASTDAETVTITAVDNTRDEANRSGTVTGSAANSRGTGGMLTVTGAALTLEDDDAAPTVTLSLDDASISENGGTAEVTATLSGGTSDAATTVTIAAVSGLYTVEQDAVIAIAAGATTDAETVTITAVDNTRDEANRSGTVTGTAANSRGAGGMLPVTGVTLTLEDDDGAPSLSISSPSVAEGDSGTTANLDFAVALSAASGQQVTVDYAVDGTDPGTATSGTDYTALAAGTLTFAVGDTSETIRVLVTGDTQDEPNETVRITLSGAVNASISTATGVGTITDDDAAPTASLSLNPASIAENGGTAQVSATLDRASSAATTVTVAAVAGAYTVPASANTITIAAGATTGGNTVTITAVDNQIDAADNTVTVAGAAANSQGVAAAATGASLTITDDDVAGLTVVESGGTTVTTEAGGTDTFTVRLASQPTAMVTVSIAVSGGDTDEATVDISSLRFDAAASGSAPNQVFKWDAPQTVTATGQDDGILDGTREYTITVSAASAQSNGDATYNSDSLVPDVTVTGRNRDDEAPTVTLALSSATIEEGGAATLTASLDRTVTEATTVTVAVEPGPGAAAADFRLSGTTLTIPAGQTQSAGVTITAVDNNVDAPDKTATVSGTAAGGQGAADPDPLTLTVTDDEAAPVPTLMPADPEIWESGAGSRTAVSARLSHASSMATTITVQAIPNIYRVVGRATIVIPAFQTTSSDRVTIEAVDNQEVAMERDPVVMIRGTARNDQGAGAVRAQPLTVLDDETASVSLALEPARVAEGGTARVSATLTRAVSAAVSVTISAEPGDGATAASFRLGAERTLTVPAGATASTGSVTITAVDDAVDAPDREVTVTAAVAAGVRARMPAALTLAIEDDDETPRATLVLTPAAIDESGANNSATVSATLSGPSSEPTTIAVSAAGEGFTQRGTTLTIPALGTESAAAVAITAVDDEEQNPDREVVVSGRAENAHGVEQPADAVLTIRDDDGADAVTEVLLPEAARAMADSRAAAVRERLRRAGAAEASELPSLSGLLAQHGPAAQEDELEWKTLLPQASFALPLDADGGSGGITVWGGGDYRDLDGEARGVSWDGEVASAHLGADRLLANGLRVGLAASWSEAKFDYGYKNREGEWNLEMTSAQPYLGWTTAGGLELWASAGAGSGDLEIVSGGLRQTADADMWMAAAGARGPLYATAGGLEIALRGEALYSSFEVDGDGGRIRGHTADVSRLRLALEARRERTLESGALLAPRFELGVRHDGGDGETGAGVELGGGARYAAGRLSVSGGARALVAHSDYDEWGADLALEYAAGADGRGFSFRLEPAWGAAESGTQALWEQGAPGLDGTAAAEPELGGRLAAELGYGMKSPWSRGLLRLTLGGEAGEDADAVGRLTGTVELDAAATLGLELEVRDSKSGGAEHSLMLKGELRF